MVKVVISIALIFALLFFGKGHAQDDRQEKKLNFTGDVRLRAEFDRNSRRVDGTERDDRDRIRYRLRFGFSYAMNKIITFGGRIRSGNPKNQQSPHVTLGNGPELDAVSIDKVYVKFTTKHIWAWAGKNNMPFWKQNELLWDDDVNPEGIAIGTTFKLSENAGLSPLVGYFIAQNSDNKFSDDGRLFVGQLKFQTAGSNKITLSSGIIYGNNIADTPDETQTFKIDYALWISSFQFNVRDTGLTVGLDYSKNLANYKNNVDVPDIFEDQTNGFVGNLTYNTVKFMAGYYYARVQKFAVIDYYAADDWVRWGTNNYTRASNFTGHELRFKYKFTEKFDSVIRFYSVKGIKTTGVAFESGTRIRIDLNLRF